MEDKDEKKEEKQEEKKEQNPQEKQEKKPQQKPQVSAEKKILIIDDNDQDRKIMKRFFNEAGYENIVTASTGEEGVEKASVESPDLVVVDTVLPGINGFEVCRQIKSRRGQDQKIIVITGSVDAIDAVKAKKAGADDYCVKTIRFAPLIDAIKRIFG